MDNRLFNVNGLGKEFLIETIKLVCYQENSSFGVNAPNFIKGWIFDKDKGLILLSYVSDSDNNVNKFIAPLTYEAVGAMVWEWLQSDEAKTIPTNGDWEGDSGDNDVDTELGFRVYVENWGHVGTHQGGVLAAVKPVYLWYGQ